MLNSVRFGAFTKVVCPEMRPALFSQQEAPEVAKGFDSYLESVPDVAKRLVVIGPNERLLVTGEEDLARFQKAVDKATTKPAKEAEAPKPASSSVLTGWGSFVKSVRETAETVKGQLGGYFDLSNLSKVPTEADIATEYARTAVLEGNVAEIKPEFPAPEAPAVEASAAEAPAAEEPKHRSGIDCPGHS